MKNRIILYVSAFSLAIMMVSCGGHDPKKPGKIYMPDMTYSNALEAYSPSVIVNKMAIVFLHVSQ